MVDDEAAWAAEGASRCEGINHEDAPVVEAEAAAVMLKAAARYMAAMENATPANRRGPSYRSY